MVDKYGEATEEFIEEFGMDINGCIKAILINDKHRDAFVEFTEDELKSRKTLYLYDGGVKTLKQDNTPGIKEFALAIRQFTAQNNIPIIMFIPGVTTNREILSQIY